MPKNFRRAFGVGLLSMVILVIAALFVSMLLVSRGKSYQTKGFGNGMMDSSLSLTEKSPAMMDWSVGSVRQSAESVPTANMMNRVDGAPDMMGIEKKMIKTGSLSVRVQNVDEAIGRVAKIAEEMGGDVADSRFARVASGTKSGTLTVKVPADKFQETFSRLKEVAVVVLSENTTGTDVTAQYIDLQARINNKKAAEATLQTLFERAVKISDVIEITDKLAIVRSEIESLEGQARYIDSQARMASITLSLTEDVIVTPSQGFRPAETLRESLTVLIHSFESFASGGIRFLVVGLPVLALDGLILWVFYRIARKIVTMFWSGRIEERRRVVRRK